jgi:Ca2+-binding RTX toxin-like protein
MNNEESVASSFTLLVSHLILQQAGELSMATFFGNDTADIQTSGIYNDMYGAGGNDNLVSAGGVVEGGAGDDIVALAGTVTTSVLAGYGGEGNDTLVGGVGLSIGLGDLLYGGSGDDILYGDSVTNDSVGYADYLDGGLGKDTLKGQDGNDILYGGDGDDTPMILYHMGYFFIGDGGLFGGDGNDYLDGGRGGDALVGGGGNDYIDGGQGYDFLQGGDGNDVILTGEGPDQAFGGAGDDYLFADYTVWTTSTFATLYGGDGADTVVGGDGADTLGGDEAGNFPIPGTGNDLIWARGGDDTLYGGDGSDNIVGGTGNDSYYGGLGADYFNLYFDVQPGSTDYLMDFSAAQGDYVVLPSYAANDVHFGVYGNYAYGYLSTSAGTYLFLAANTAVADLQYHVAYY